ncbi:MAG: hypothetical protein ACI81Q_001219, partial [Paracoccaceae bacterium]
TKSCCQLFAHEIMRHLPPDTGRYHYFEDCDHMIDID